MNLEKCDGEGVDEKKKRFSICSIFSIINVVLKEIKEKEEEVIVISNGFL